LLSLSQKLVHVPGLVAVTDDLGRGGDQSPQMAFS